MAPPSPKDDRPHNPLGDTVAGLVHAVETMVPQVAKILNCLEGDPLDRAAPLGLVAEVRKQGHELGNIKKQLDAKELEATATKRERGSAWYAAIVAAVVAAAVTKIDWVWSALVGK